MRRKIVAGNWKMNLDLQQGMDLLSGVVKLAGEELRGTQELIVCTPFVHLYPAAQLLAGWSGTADGAGLFIGAQNIHHERSGAYTGEVSATQVASVGARYVIIGHSERRMYFREDAFMLSKKIDLALEAGLHPIYCVGESLEERESGNFFKVINRQLEEVLGKVPVDDMARIVIAYEPVWAIGTGLTATPEQAQEVHAHIREKLSFIFNYQVADQTSILYGGSCNPGNAAALFAQADIDGGLIGGASLKARDFIDIAKAYNDR